MKKKTIFLDRDGVINKEVNYLFKIDDFIFQKGIFNACNHFIELNYELIIITNQSGISRGLYSEKDYEKLTDWMIKQFKERNINILDVFHCPHSPSSMCNCRKPKPGLFNQATNKHNIDLKKSWMIGDKETDVGAANNAGINNTILVRGFHKIDESNSKATYILDSIDQSVKYIKN